MAHFVPSDVIPSPSIVRHARGLVVPLLVGGLLLGVTAPQAHGATPTTQRVSLGPGGAQVAGASQRPALSANGRFVAFESEAPDLVPGDTNDRPDIFVRDRRQGVTTRVSLGAADAEADGSSLEATISADGRFVAFSSSAGNLAASDTNGKFDIFVRDRKLGLTTLVSAGVAGSQSNGDSYQPVISADGRFVAFTSDATNLVDGDSNGELDVFVHDRRTGRTGLVSRSTKGRIGNGFSGSPSISADGRFVAFDSGASNLVSNDTNGRRDIFVRDRKLRTTTRVSVRSNGAQATDDSYYTTISANGRYVGFSSNAANLVSRDSNGTADVFVHDRASGRTSRVGVSSKGAQGSDLSEAPALSADGRFVSFFSRASNLVARDSNGQPDIFVHDRSTGKTRRMSVRFSGGQSSGSSYFHAISADGRFVAFDSGATNLVSNDTNDKEDIFVRGPLR